MFNVNVFYIFTVEVLFSNKSRSRLRRGKCKSQEGAKTDIIISCNVYNNDLVVI